MMSLEESACFHSRNAVSFKIRNKLTIRNLASSKTTRKCSSGDPRYFDSPASTVAMPCLLKSGKEFTQGLGVYMCFQ